MAIPTPVNGMITDSVTQQNVTVLASAPAMAMSSIYQSAAHSLGILFQNATQAQMQSAICAQAATNMGIMQIYSTNTIAASVATSNIARSDNPDTLLSLLVALHATKV